MLWGASMNLNAEILYYVVWMMPSGRNILNIVGTEEGILL
jgi:hypothetical protein